MGHLIVSCHLPNLQPSRCDELTEAMGAKAPAITAVPHSAAPKCPAIPLQRPADLRFCVVVYRTEPVVS